MGSRAQAQQLWLTGLVVPRHVGSSWARARTRVPCIGRQTLNHCATREAPHADLDVQMRASVPGFDGIKSEVRSPAERLGRRGWM